MNRNNIFYTQLIGVAVDVEAVYSILPPVIQYLWKSMLYNSSWYYSALLCSLCHSCNSTLVHYWCMNIPHEEEFV